MVNRFHNPQNVTPAAIVVHKVIANQLPNLRMGFASGPPILTLPSGEK